MSRRIGAALFLCLALLFLLAHRGAYRGYFQDDELDNISWAPAVPGSLFLQDLVTPKFLTGNFRPVGHFYFAFFGRHFGLDFPKYIFPLHALHLLNVWLIWLIARRLGATPFAAGCGALFFAFEMAAFDVLWKPMYVFDLLCATFSLASLYFYIRRWLIASFAAFWLAYKSKELAVMLPAILAAYEYWLGKRRWRPLVPFFLVSLSFGIQGLLFNPNRDNDYAFQFGPGAILQSALFYANHILLVPFAGLFLLILPFLTRRRLVWFGVAAMLLFFFPLLFLPQRTLPAYCYLPLTGLALACAGIAETRSRVLVLLFFLLWIPWNEVVLRRERRQTLAADDENREYVQALAGVAATYPAMRNFVYDGAPPELRPWGIRGALRVLYRAPDIRVTGSEDRNVQEALAAESLTILGWDSPRRKLSVAARGPGVRDVSYIRMSRATPLWQMDDGWFTVEQNQYRWTKPHAAARLYRPPGVRAFELIVNISPEMLRDIGGTTVELRLDGQSLGHHTFASKGWQAVRWDLAPAPAGEAAVEFVCEPAYHPPPPDSRVLGVPIVAFGFVTENP